jgi:hypothetical protein
MFLALTRFISLRQRAGGLSSQHARADVKGKSEALLSVPGVVIISRSHVRFPTDVRFSLTIFFVRFIRP